MKSASGAESSQSLEQEVSAYLSSLYPICRSITGDGVRQTLQLLAEIVPLSVRDVPSGTEVLGWKIPQEWRVREAWVKDPMGKKVIDFAAHNLHLVSYSSPVHQRMSLEQLKPHLHSLPAQPALIPYRTTYYREDWGFCLTQQALEGLSAGTYEVFVDSSLAPGVLNYGELTIAGESEQEVLISTHLCHPSLANDNLSGLLVAAFLARELLAQAQVGRLRYTYRFLFVPGTIGAVTWLALNQGRLANIKHGLTLACLGDGGVPTYKRSQRSNATIDAAVERVLEARGAHELREFSPFGYDERQYCSPGFDLPVGSLTRTPSGMFPEYHTSADNLDFVQPDKLLDSLDICRDVVESLERDRIFLNLAPHGEPQLGKYRLYDTLGGAAQISQSRQALLWMLNQSDGERGLLAISRRSGLEAAVLCDAAHALVAAGLLREVTVDRA